MRIEPITLQEANSFIERYHRHHGKVQGHKFSICVRNEESIIGIAVVGRPVSRMLDNGVNLEITRLATDGTPNACSMLLGAARRAAKAMGYKRVITYILGDEPGISLKSAGFELKGFAGGGSWSRIDRVREDKHPTSRKKRYEAQL